MRNASGPVLRAEVRVFCSSLDLRAISTDLLAFARVSSCSATASGSALLLLFGSAAGLAPGAVRPNRTRELARADVGVAPVRGVDEVDDGVVLIGVDELARDGVAVKEDRSVGGSPAPIELALLLLLASRDCDGVVVLARAVRAMLFTAKVGPSSTLLDDVAEDVRCCIKLLRT
jgi:hypothetical protein